MGVEYPPDVLHIQPNAIPAIRKEYKTTLAQANSLIKEMEKGALIDKPWLGDPVSADTAAYYNTHVMQASDGPFGALKKWRDELQKTHDTLVQIEATYRRTEGDNAELWGRKA